MFTWLRLQWHFFKNTGRNSAPYYVGSKYCWPVEACGQCRAAIAKAKGV